MHYPQWWLSAWHRRPHGPHHGLARQHKSCSICLSTWNEETGQSRWCCSNRNGEPSLVEFDVRGSVVTRVFGAGAPDGMNDQGLAVHGLWFHSADYGPRDTAKKGILVTSCPQYLLDHGSTVEQVLQIQQRIQPIEVQRNGGRAPVSIAVEDASGDSEILQYINGQLTVHHGRRYTVMNNDPPCDETLAQLDKYDFSSPSQSTFLHGSSSSVDRFISASYFRQ